MRLLSREKQGKRQGCKMTVKVYDLKALLSVIDEMPLYGKLRKRDKRLTFGQYLTVLKEWFDAVQSEAEDLDKYIRKLLASKSVEYREMTAEEAIMRVLGEWKR